SLGFELCRPYFVVTYHPVTALNEDPGASFAALLQALDAFPDSQVVMTYPNADNGGRGIIPMIEDYARQNTGRVLAIPSLGFARYLTAVSASAAVIGNSSSGIIEVPAFGVPTVDIGVRQQGRLVADSVLHVEPDGQAITDALNLAVSAEFKRRCGACVNPY